MDYDEILEILQAAKSDLEARHARLDRDLSEGRQAHLGELERCYAAVVSLAMPISVIQCQLRAERVQLREGVHRDQ